MDNFVNLRDAKKILEMNIDLGISTILLGDPGIGKTSLFFNMKDSYFIKLFEAPTLSELDTRGVIIPVNDKDSRFTKSPLYPKPEELEYDKVIILIDELSSAIPAVQVSLHSLFLERRLGEHKLPENVVIAATGNFQDTVGVVGLTDALSDRLSIIPVKADLDVWKHDFAYPNKIHPVVIAFLTENPSLFTTYRDKQEGVEGKSFVTPRSHTFISKILYYSEKKKYSKEVVYSAINSVAGPVVASEYKLFMETNYKTSHYVDSILKHGICEKELNNIELSVVLTNCIYKLSNENVEKYISNFVSYLGKIKKEYALVAIKDFISFDQTNKQALSNCREWINLSKEIREVINTMHSL